MGVGERHDADAAAAVRCLSCRHVYGKPDSGGTAVRNPGCPSCGYVGWVAVGAVVTPLRPYELTTA